MTDNSARGRAGHDNRPKSAFTYFSEDWRDRLRAEYPDASFGEIDKLIGAKWKELDYEEKWPYMEAAKQGEARYERESE